jgi:ribonuclease E
LSEQTNKAVAPKLDQLEGPAQTESGSGGSPEGPARPRRRRRRRTGRRPSGQPRTAQQDGSKDPSEGETVPVRSVLSTEEVDLEPAPEGAGADGGAAARKRPSSGQRRRRSRGGRSGAAGARSGKATSAKAEAAAETAEEPIPEPDAAEGEAPAEGEATQASKPRRRRRGGRGKSGRKPAGTGGATATDAAPEEKVAAEAVPAEAPAKPEPEAPTQTRTARKPRTQRRRREPSVPVKRVADKVMLITEIGDRDQIAVLEDRTLVEHYITRAGARSMVGNIYLGKVQNVLPGMEAAFVDIGRGRNAVLYAGEVSYDEEVDGQTPRIEKVLRGGQNIMAQITKDPMGGKGARLTQEISLPGRYLVLVPNSQVFGISRRLPDKERARLKDILKRIRPPEHGVIVRTAAEGASADDLEADLARLIEEWNKIAKSAKRGKAPRVLYEEPELTVRVVRDLFTAGEFKEIVTDSTPIYDQVVAYLQSVAPDLVPKVHMHQGPLPLLETYHVTEQIHKALERKVWLPSGGYIVIDRTEAMTVIDVNTGKHVGKANLEETVTKTNLEAAEEIARQLRLRDIGGIIIIDFIDMLLERNKDKVIQTLRNAMAQDKTRSQIFDIGPLGLLEVTRKRVSAGLLESFSETCPTCEGRGILLTYKL